MTTETVKGFKDFTGEEAVKRERIRAILVRNFEKYGFEPAEPPIIEYREFVKGDNENDEAVSNIFKLEDRGKRELALRYEFTFQLKRLAQGKKLPYKRYQIGPVFRDEPISGNRLRQFTQCDVDVVSSSLKEEAEILAVVKSVLTDLKTNFTIYINNRKLLNEILEKENIEKMDWEKVIREIDKLDKLSEDEVFNNLRGYGAQNLLELFKKPDNFFEKYENYKEIKELKEYCSFFGVDVKFSPSLARGLSYYNGSVFEVKTKEMKETIAGGGSYLINGIQSTGISFGLERLSTLVKTKFEDKKAMVLSISQDKKAIEIAEFLRSKGINCDLSFAKISKALDCANSCGTPFVIFVGEEEVKKKKFKLRDMKTGKEKLLKIEEIVKNIA